MLTNEPNLTPPKSPSDPFYSERNLQHLEQIVQDIKNGTAHFAEHNLIEDETQPSTVFPSVLGCLHHLFLSATRILVQAASMTSSWVRRFVVLSASRSASRSFS